MSDSFLDHIRLSSNKRSSSLYPNRYGKKILRKWKVAEEVNFPEEAERLVSIPSDCATDSKRVPEFNSHNFRQRGKQASRSLATGHVLSGEQNCAVGEASSENNESRISDPFHKCEFAILNIEDGDTLQSISLKYHCSVSDIKRANNLISSQEFYALRQLKIPIRKHGMLREKLPIIENPGSVYPFIPKNDNVSVKAVNIGIGPMIPGGCKEDAVAFFRKMDEDLVKIMLSTKSQKDSLEAAAVALTSPHIQPLIKENIYSGIDCGIQWCSLVILMIIIGLILPITIIVCMYSRPPSELNDHTYFDNNISVVINSFNKLPVEGKS